MKKIVYAFGVLYAAAGVLLLLSALPNNVADILPAVLVLLSAVPFFALGRTMSETEDLQAKLEDLERRLHAHCRADEPPVQPVPPPAPPQEQARHSWTCVKCGSVNKRGTTTCESCGAHYSAWVNPTQAQPGDPL